MKITFHDTHIIPGLQGKDSLQVIDELVAQLVSAGALTADAAELAAIAIRQRERSMSTGIGFGVAIPHASTPAVNDLVLAFGRSMNGIEFNALDGQPVRLVVLMIVPANGKEKHLPTLSRISRLLHGKDVRAALESAADATALAGILNGHPAVQA